MTTVTTVGYRWCSSAEIVQITDSRARVASVLMDHREEPFSAAIRRAAPPRRIPCTGEAVQEAGLTVVFLATPPEVSLELAPAMLAAGARVVDLSGAFRLRTPENYAAWYKEPHTQPALLNEAVYSIPEFHRDLVPG